MSNDDRSRQILWIVLPLINIQILCSKLKYSFVGSHDYSFDKQQQKSKYSFELISLNLRFMIQFSKNTTNSVFLRKPFAIFKQHGLVFGEAEILQAFIVQKKEFSIHQKSRQAEWTTMKQSQIGTQVQENCHFLLQQLSADYTLLARATNERNSKWCPFSSVAKLPKLWLLMLFP